MVTLGLLGLGAAAVEARAAEEDADNEPRAASRGELLVASLEAFGSIDACAAVLAIDCACWDVRGISTTAHILSHSSTGAHARLN